MAIIQCSGCGQPISDQAVSCPKCGVALNNKEQPYIDEKSLEKFNWGAALMWPFWGFGNGMWWLFFVNSGIYIYSEIMHGYFTWLFLVMQMAISVLLGKKGNRLSWQNRKWDSVARFKKAQKNWAMIGYVMMGLIYLLGLLQYISNLI